MDGYISEIRMFAGNFAPRNWAFCNGQLVMISQNTALFSLVGTTYGGNGTNNFALPDFRSRVVMGTGQGPGLTNRSLGEAVGTETEMLSPANVAGHGHTLTGTAGIFISSQDGHTPIPVNNFPAVNGDFIYSATTDNSVMAPASTALTLGPTGNASPASFNNIQPYLGINYIICLAGIFPSRN